jgi:hypothetical protein
MTDTVRSLIDAELVRPPESVVAMLAASLAHTGNRPALAVLFYGSALRNGELRDGILDFYVIVEDLADWHRSEGVRRANEVLPPNVEYHEMPTPEGTLRAKVAILSRRQLRYLTGATSLDSSVWARFSQPVILAWWRDDAARAAITECIGAAVCTAARWAALLGPAHGTAAQFWQALFQHTYGAELRIEREGRARELVNGASARFTALLPLAWAEAGIPFTLGPRNEFMPRLTPGRRAWAARSWWLRRRLGRVLNALRLIKAAFTFTGGPRYIAWKIRRHTGFDIGLTGWQERHPVIAAPRVLWQLWREGILR